MDFSGDHLMNISASGLETTLPSSVSLEDSYSHLSGYTCINVEETQFYFPNKLQVVVTLQWLTSNYEPAEGVSLPRCDIYKYYSDFCKRQQFQPVNTASFGKVMRQVFPELKTRRLGTRGQSKYHYYGLRVKKSSPYYNELVASQRECTQSIFNSPSSGPLHTLYDMSGSKPNMVPHASCSKLNEDKGGEFLLPEFPDAEQIQLNDRTMLGKVDSFLETYRSHCQKLLETVLNGKLEEVHFYIERFWHELSDSLQQLLHTEIIALTVAVCDKLLYQTIISILMPGIVQHLIPSLLHGIRHFSCTFVKHLEGALIHQPSVLVEKKLEVAQDFASLLKRKTSLSHLAQAMFTVLKTDGSVKQMLHDWRKRTEHNTVRSQLLWLVNDDEGPDRHTINKYLCEFVWLLDKKITVEDHLKWLESVRKRCLSQYDGLCVEKKADHERRFMLQFCYLSNLIIRDQTLRSATSFGSFHLLHLMYEEYLLYVLDVNKIQQHEQAIWKQLYGPHTKVPDSFLTILGVASLDRPYTVPRYTYQSNTTAAFQQIAPMGVGADSFGNYPQFYSSGEMMPRSTIGVLPQACPNINANNGAQLPLTDPTIPHLHPSSTTLMQPSLPVTRQLCVVSSSSPGGFTSNSFAPIVYSPLMPSSTVSSSIISSSLITPSPLSALLTVASPKSNYNPLSTATPVKLPGSASAGSTSETLQTKPLNLSNTTHKQPNTSSPGTTKFTATQVLKASLLDAPPDKDSVKSSVTTTITLAVPLAQGLNLSKGQVLKLSDGKSYNIDEVQTVLKESTPQETPVSTSV